MKITAARYADGELHLQCPQADARRLVYGFKAGDYDLVPHKDKRSLNANSYAWSLINKIAAAVGESPIDIYKQQTADMADTVDSRHAVPDEKVKDYILRWQEGHLGRQCLLYPSQAPGYTVVTRIYGSSDYDTKQMSRFIDGLLQECEALDIETKDPGYIAALLRDWRAT